MNIDEIPDELLDRMALAMVHWTANHYGDALAVNPDLSLTRELARVALSVYLADTGCR